MSGGSYNYLCHAADLDDMAKRLAGLGYARDAALETEELATLLRQWDIRATARISRLAEVWKAIEWWDSCDYGEDDVHGALTQYRKDQPQGGASVAKPAVAEGRPRKIIMVNGATETINATGVLVSNRWVYLYEGDREVFAAPESNILYIRDGHPGDTVPAGGKAPTP